MQIEDPFQILRAFLGLLIIALIIYVAAIIRDSAVKRREKNTRLYTTASPNEKD